MSFSDQLRKIRTEKGLSRTELADMLGVAVSAVGNYESGHSMPKTEILLRMFDCLDTDPNTLFRDSFRGGHRAWNEEERALVENYRSLSPMGRETVRSVVEALCAYRDDLETSRVEAQEPRVIPLYRSPAAAGYTSPVFGEDFDYLTVEGEVPRAAEFAVRIQGDSMAPRIADDSVVYVNHDPLKEGDVGIFCVDGEMFCKQYYRAPNGIVYLFSLNRARADADLVFTPASGRSLVCMGRVMMRAMPLPGRA